MTAWLVSAVAVAIIPVAICSVNLAAAAARKQICGMGGFSQPIAPAQPSPRATWPALGLGQEASVGFCTSSAAPGALSQSMGLVALISTRSAASSAAKHLGAGMPGEFRAAMLAAATEIGRAHV